VWLAAFVLVDASFELEDAADRDGVDAVLREFGGGGKDFEVSSRVAALISRGTRARVDGSALESSDGLRVDAEKIGGDSNRVQGFVGIVEALLPWP